MYKISLEKMLAPMKLFINYEIKDHAGSKICGDKSKSSRDLRIIYSRTNPKPDETNCEGIAENVACLSLNATGGARNFSKDYVYLRFESK